MEVTVEPTPTVGGSTDRRRRLLMCPPRHFDVVYTINPWMDPGRPVDRARALRQWSALRNAYEAHGHTVETVTPQAGLPDMVYAANSALVLDGTAFLARFRHSQRRGEEDLYARWFANHGFSVARSEAVHEGEGDFAILGNTILAGTGFRTSRVAHAEAGALFDRPVVPLQLVDPRFYHLDTALCVLGDGQLMYYPGAFSESSRARLRRRFPDAILADQEDALAFGLNALSDGYNVFLEARADKLASRLAAAGFRPVPVDVSELLRGGGGVKCCTLEIRGSDTSIREEQA